MKNRFCILLLSPIALASCAYVNLNGVSDIIPFQNQELYDVGNYNSAEDFQSIYVHWIGGNITFGNSGSSSLVIYEGDDPTAKTEMVHLLFDKTVYIQPRMPGTYKTKELSHDLHVLLPDDPEIVLTRFTLDTVNANLNGDIPAKQFDIDEISGTVDITSPLLVEEIIMDSTSGSFKYEGEVDKIIYYGVSGSVNVKTSGDFTDYRFDTVSGGGDITLNQGAGASIDFRSVSGTLDNRLSKVDSNHYLLWDSTSGSLSVHY